MKMNKSLAQLLKTLFGPDRKPFFVTIPGTFDHRAIEDLASLGIVKVEEFTSPVSGEKRIKATPVCATISR